MATSNPIKAAMNVCEFVQISKVEDKDFAYSIIRVDHEIPKETISVLLEIDNLIEIKQFYL